MPIPLMPILSMLPLGAATDLVHAAVGGRRRFCSCCRWGPPPILSMLPLGAVLPLILSMLPLGAVPLLSEGTTLPTILSLSVDCIATHLVPACSTKSCFWSCTKCSRRHCCPPSPILSLVWIPWECDAAPGLAVVTHAIVVPEHAVHTWARHCCTWARH